MIRQLSQFKSNLTQEDKDKLLNLDFSAKKESDRDEVWNYLEHVQRKYNPKITLRRLYHLAIELGAEE